MNASPLGNLDRGELGTLYAIARILNSTLDLDQVVTSRKPITDADLITEE